MKIPSVIAVMIASAVALASSLHAQTTTNNAYRIESGSWSASSGSYVVGFEFQVNNTITISHLGVADWFNNGLATTAPQVGVWTTNGSLLASVTVPLGTAASLVEPQANPAVTCYFEALGTNLTLAPGRYVIANQHFQIAGSQVFGWGGPMSWNPSVTWVQGRATTSGAPFGFPNSIFYTAGHAYVGPNFKFTSTTPPGMVSLSRPLARAIHQRNTNDLGTVGVSGSCSEGLDRLEVRAVPRVGHQGVASDWSTLVATPGTSFSNSVTLAAGWYDLEVRSVLGGQVVSTGRVERVGVGDLLITAGQSNSANHGAPAQSPTNDAVSVLNLNTGSWQTGGDPQPYATGSGGSPWPPFGDRLAARTQRPVGVVAVGVGATTVAQWVPDTGTYYPRLALAIQSLKPYGGCRAILWHQGESDSLAATTPANYASRLNSIITRSRADAGFSVPWGLALASWHPDATAPNEAQVIAGQWLVLTNTPGVFKGAETDNFHLWGWLSDTVHFNTTGLRDHGRQWSDAVWYSLLNRTAPTNALNLTNGTATLDVRGNPNCTYTLQTTTRLSDPWQPRDTRIAGANGLLRFTDPKATNHQQFYRTVQP